MSELYGIITHSKDYDPNHRGSFITHPLEILELEYLTELSKIPNASQENEKHLSRPGCVQLTMKRYYDFSNGLTN
jgi:hypothetical protein